MNMTAGLLGFGSFVFACTLIGLTGYWQADHLEVWARNKFGRGGR